MSQWLGSSLTQFTDQLSSLKEVLSESTEESQDALAELQLARGRIRDLEAAEAAQIQEVERVKHFNEELRERVQASELQVNTISQEYRHMLIGKEDELANLKQELARCQDQYNHLLKDTFTRTDKGPALGYRKADLPAALSETSLSDDQPDNFHDGHLINGEALRDELPVIDGRISPSDHFLQLNEDSWAEDFGEALSSQTEINRLSNEVQRSKAECLHWKRVAQSFRKTRKGSSEEPLSPSQSSDAIVLQNEIKMLRETVKLNVDEHQRQLAALHQLHADKVADIRREHQLEIDAIEVRSVELEKRLQKQSDDDRRQSLIESESEHSSTTLNDVLVGEVTAALPAFSRETVDSLKAELENTCDQLAKARQELIESREKADLDKDKLVHAHKVAAEDLSKELNNARVLADEANLRAAKAEEDQRVAVSVLEERLQVLQGQCEQNQNDVEEFHCLRTEYEDAKNQIEQSHAEISQLQVEKSRLEEEVHQLADRCKDAEKKEREKMETLLKDCDADITRSATVACSDQFVQCEVACTQCQLHLAALDRLQEHCDNLLAQSEDQRKKTINEQHQGQRLAAEMKGEQEDDMFTAKQVAVLKEQLAEAEKRRDTAEKATTNLRAHLVELSAEHDKELMELVSEREELLQRFDGNDVSSASDDTLAYPDYQRQLAAVTAALESSRRVAEQAKDEQQSTNERLSATQEQLQQLYQRHQEVCAEHKASLQELTSLRETAARSSTDLLAQFNKVVAERDDLESQLLRISEQGKFKEEAFSQLRAERDRLVSECDHLLQEKDSLYQTLASLEAKVDSLETQLQQACIDEGQQRKEITEPVEVETAEGQVRGEPVSVNTSTRVEHNTAVDEPDLAAKRHDKVVKSLEQRCASLMEQLQQATAAQQHWQAQMQAYDQAAQVTSNNFQIELKRLRDHLLQVETQHNEELLAAEQREQQLTAEVNHLQQQLHQSTSLSQSHHHAVALELEKMQEQVISCRQERDEAIQEAAEAQSRVEANGKALSRLQLVLEEFERERGEAVVQAVALADDELARTHHQLAELQSWAQQSRPVLDEASKTAAQLNSVQQQLQSKLHENEQLHESVVRLQAEAQALQCDLAELRGNKIDRELMKNLLLSYLSAPTDKKDQVLQPIASIIGFSGVDFAKVSKQRAGWLRGWWSSSNKSPPVLDRSFTELFVEFLEAESSPRALPGNTSQFPQLSPSPSQPGSSIGRDGNREEHLQSEGFQLPLLHTSGVAGLPVNESAARPSTSQGSNDNGPFLPGVTDISLHVGFPKRNISLQPPTSQSSTLQSLLNRSSSP